MSKCSRCGADTKLHVDGVPVCVGCDNSTPSSPPKNFQPSRGKKNITNVTLPTHEPVAGSGPLATTTQNVRSSQISREDVERALRDELAIARDEFRRAVQAFEAVIGDIPSGLPHPDGVQRMHNVSREHSAARDRLVSAIKRMNEFFLDETVPEDSKHER